MTHVITSFCLHDGSCVEVCPTECIVVGKPVEERTVEYFSAIQTTLAACHDPRYALIFINLSGAAKAA